MRSSPEATADLRPVRTRLLDAGVTIVRRRGYAATTIDELCRAAGVTKGGFFHHFASKDAYGVALADHWSETTGRLFAAAPYHRGDDPLERIFAYLDLRAALIDGPIDAFTCVVGTLAQEIHLESPTIRDACGRSIFGHASTLEADFAAALAARGLVAPTARSLALHTQAVIQGGFVLAKAAGDAEAAREAVAHLRRYVALLFERETTVHEGGGSDVQQAR
ncbi:TetR/AcrR family transcriptional regulator [Siculibacillus lacustris]|uniref:TetR/AcrR family transcriptional regulator n=1 Tax=Siculibacillus lacustris TaxID=1549641 RepID=A0A4Q9VX09_9HYPH|nr:TetR/AcrR family transcriptional regulator [Siculibacillus lacustris]TBW40908.1 TetR/AcrR family transcriptional regulator [Siculibacillus lacustris]